MPKRKPKKEKNPSARTPDYILRAMSKDDDFKGEVGAGWIDHNEYDSITIKLNPFVVLNPRADNLTLKLFPNTYQRKAKAREPDPEDYEPEELDEDEEADLEPLPPKPLSPEDDIELKISGY